MRLKRSVSGLGLRVLLGTLVASTAQAGGYSVGVTGGLGEPTSAFSDAYESGYNVAGTLDYRMNMMFGAGLDFGYHSWDASTAYELGLTTLGVADGMAAGAKIDDTVNATRYGIHGTLAPPILGALHPYGQFGIAEYTLKEKAVSTDPSYDGDFVGILSEGLFGWNAGAGMDFSLMPTLSFGVLGLFHNVNSKADFGAEATWYEVNGTLTFHVPLAK